ncbi:unnamed protein product [Dicrocoelium dendriticum]|nr:unnamed protein product [Dicrocoelium dendriticum]
MEVTEDTSDVHTEAGLPSCQQMSCAQKYTHDCSVLRCDEYQPVPKFCEDYSVSNQLDGVERDKITEKLTKGKQKIPIEFIHDRTKRYATFSKRKTGMMKKAVELAELTGAEVLLLIASETNHVYTYATRRLRGIIDLDCGKELIKMCLSADDNLPSGSEALKAKTKLSVPDMSKIYNGCSEACHEAVLQSSAHYSFPPTKVDNEIRFEAAGSTRMRTKSPDKNKASTRNLGTRSYVPIAPKTPELSSKRQRTMSLSEADEQMFNVCSSGELHSQDTSEASNDALLTQTTSSCPVPTPTYSLLASSGQPVVFLNTQLAALPGSSTCQTLPISPREAPPNQQTVDSSAGSHHMQNATGNVPCDDPPDCLVAHSSSETKSTSVITRSPLAKTLLPRKPFSTKPKR